jgi:ATP-dependent DNA helicase RecG
MTFDELKRVVAGGESEQVEFKRSTTQSLEIQRTVCAMLNTRGGLLLIGVDDAGMIVGQDLSASAYARLMEALDRIHPRARFSPEVMPVEKGRAVVALRIPAATVAVHLANGLPFERVRATHRLMNEHEYARRKRAWKRAAGWRWNRAIRKLDPPPMRLRDWDALFSRQRRASPPAWWSATP